MKVKILILGLIMLGWGGIVHATDFISGFYIGNLAYNYSGFATGTNYLGNTSTGWAAGENNVRTPVSAITVEKVVIRTYGAQPGTGSCVLTLRKNNAATTLTYTIASSGPAGIYTLTGNSVSYSSGDLLALQAVNNASTNGCVVNSVFVSVINTSIDGEDGTNGTNGTNGVDGDDGQSVTVTVEAAGSNCANGGQKLVSVSGTAYVCNGIDGEGGGGTELPDDAAGWLENDGSGNLSWTDPLDVPLLAESINELFLLLTCAFSLVIMILLFKR